MPSARSAAFESLERRRQFAAGFPHVFGGAGFDNAQKITTDSTGIVVVGQFSGTTNFSAPGARARTLTARGDTDVYVARYDLGGALQWAVRVGGDFTNKDFDRFTRRDVEISQNRLNRYIGRVGSQVRNAGEYANDVAVDASGNVYVVGAFRDSIRVGDTTLTADQTYTSSYYDAMVLKFSPTGQLTWARQYGGAFDDDAMSVGVDGNGDVTVGGYYQRTAKLDQAGGGQIFTTDDGRDAGLILRFSAGGKLAWSYQFESEAIGTDERNAVNDIAVTRRGEVVFVGSFASDADFQPGKSEYILKSQDKTDAVVGRLNRKGALVWAESTGGGDYDANSAVTLDADGNIYTAGYFSDDSDVDPRPDVEKIYTATPEDTKENRPKFSDVLVSKLSADGTPAWQAQLGGGYIETVGDITVGPDGGVYTTGSFFNTADFDPGRTDFLLSSTEVNTKSIKDDNTTFGRNESYDWYVSKLSPRGKFVAARQFGEADDDYGAGAVGFTGDTLLVYGRAVKAVGDREDRQEQSLIYQVSENLKIV